jgi:predicted dehydrogenase
MMRAVEPHHSLADLDDRSTREPRRHGRAAAPDLSAMAPPPHHGHGGPRDRGDRSHGDNRMVRVNVPNAATFTERGQETVFRPDSTGWYLSGEERFGFSQQLDAVLAAVRDGAPPPVPAAEAVRSHQLAHALLAASQAVAS